MEENQIQTEISLTQSAEPASTDNSKFDVNETVDSAEYQFIAEGQSGEENPQKQDPSGQLILGKFKSVEDLSKAYEELQRHQGMCSEELGTLRKNVLAMNQAQQNLEMLNGLQGGLGKMIQRDKVKYNSPEYFQDPSFREMYKAAFQALGENLDTDRFVNLLEGYVSSRIFANEKKKSAQKETQQVLDSMTFENNSKTSFTPPKKRFDEMSEKEIDDLLERLI